jgi:hypothetical protein
MTVWKFIQRDHPLLAREIMFAVENNLDTIDSSRIGANSRRFVWQCIQAHKPALAQLLADTGFLEVKSIFGATVELLCVDVCGAIAAHLRASRGTQVAA